MSATGLMLIMADKATATEAPTLAVSVLEYVLLGCSLIGLVGSFVMYVRQE